jgi:hypothetical protein
MFVVPSHGYTAIRGNTPIAKPFANLFMPYIASRDFFAQPKSLVFISPQRFASDWRNARHHLGG